MKIAILSLILSIFAFASSISAYGLGLNGAEYSTKQQEGELNKIKKQFQMLNGRKMELLTSREAFMLGVAYQNGIEDIGLKANNKTAVNYFNHAYDKGYGFAILHSIENYALLKDFDNIKKSISLVIKNNDDEITLLALRQASGKLIENDFYKEAYPYIKYLSDKYNNSSAQFTFSVMLNAGLGVTPNQEVANYYLNKACSNQKINIQIRNMCEQLRK